MTPILADLQDNGVCEDEDIPDTEAPWTLSPGEALTCTFTVNHTGDYYSSWTNSVYVTAVDEDGVDLSDTSNTQTVDLSDVSTPLTIVKSTESASTLPEPGGDFDFKVVVTNPSTFDDATVSDLDDTFLADLQDNGVCEDEDSDTEAPWTLSPGEALTCTFTVNHTGDYYSSWTNSVYVTAVDEDGADLSDTSNTQTVDLSDVSTPLTIVKSTESASTLPEPGGDFDFKVVVTNPSTFDDVTVSDLDDTFLADLQDNGVCEDEDSDTEQPGRSRRARP